MSSVHFLNVAPGDCSVIRHASGRVTMIDICDGNIPYTTSLGKALLEASDAPRPKGNFRMCESPTNPLQYLSELGLTTIWRFILTHPDMDHMDGFDALMNELSVFNFWDSSARKSAKPDFTEGSPYYEVDWDRYTKVRDGKDSPTSLTKLAGATFRYANSSDGGGYGDGLHILAPTANLLNDPDEDDDLNDASYVILYSSIGGRVIFPGDAHDESWQHVIDTYPTSIANCSVLIAPHHGRDSDRSYDFLDATRPALSIIGCAPSEHIDYEQWRRRGLDFITTNQAGNVVLEIATGYMDVYVENDKFAARKANNSHIKNAQGYSALFRIQNR